LGADPADVLTPTGIDQDVVEEVDVDERGESRRQSPDA
jgi:hypothetical protein